MNRPFLRELAKRAGYSVHERSCHGPGRAWDWSPKASGNHFRSEEAAWADLETAMQGKLVEAERLITLSQQIIRGEPAPVEWQRFRDGSLKPFIAPERYDELRDDDRFLYNRGPRPEGLK